MGPHGRDDDQKIRRLRLQEGVEAPESLKTRDHGDHDLVYDFTGLHKPDLCDLSLILTARLAAEPEDTVWLRALPMHTWRVLNALGLDHMFRAYPPSGAPEN
jgi:hypothetical protein